jgi:hypothetical protein
MNTPSVENDPRAADRALLERFAERPYRGRAVPKWTGFMQQCMCLAGSYREAVVKVLKAGKWRAKADPVAWVRCAAEAEAVKAFLGSTDRKLPSMLRMADIRMRDKNGQPMAHDDMVERLEPKDSSCTLWNRRTRGMRPAGEFDGLPNEDRELFFDRAPATFGSSIDDDYYERPVRRISPDVLDSDGEGVDWSKVSRKAGLDFEEERVLVETKVKGVSRDALIAKQPDEKSRKAVQAAARRLSRKMRQVGAALLYPADAETPTPVPTRADGPPKSAGEALRRIANRQRQDFSLVDGQP